MLRVAMASVGPCSRVPCVSLRRRVPYVSRGRRRGLVAGAAAGWDEGGQGAVEELDVSNLLSVLASGEKASSFQFVDVRERWEIARSNLGEERHGRFVILPLSEFDTWSNTLNSVLDLDLPIVCLCHHGVRSRQMCEFLATKGYPKLYNVTGGIDAVAMRDSSVPPY